MGTNLLNILQEMSPEAIAAFVSTIETKGITVPAKEFNDAFSSTAETLGVTQTEMDSFLSVWQLFS
jgi:hypothetical protein